MEKYGAMDKQKAAELWKQAAAHWKEHKHLCSKNPGAELQSPEPNLFEAQILSNFPATSFLRTLEVQQSNQVRKFEKMKNMAEQGHAEAQYQLGGMYFEGNGVPEDKQKGEQLWKQAAAQGHAHAQYELGCMYFYGKGVPEDKQKGAELLGQAAA